MGSSIPPWYAQKQFHSFYVLSLISRMIVKLHASCSHWKAGTQPGLVLLTQSKPVKCFQSRDIQNTNGLYDVVEYCEECERIHGLEYAKVFFYYYINTQIIKVDQKIQQYNLE